MHEFHIFIAIVNGPCSFLSTNSSEKNVNLSFENSKLKLSILATFGWSGHPVFCIYSLCKSDPLQILRFLWPRREHEHNIMWLMLIISWFRTQLFDLDNPANVGSRGVLFTTEGHLIPLGAWLQEPPLWEPKHFAQPQQEEQTQLHQQLPTVSLLLCSHTCENFVGKSA